MSGPQPEIKQEYIDKICAQLRKHAFRETAFASVPVIKRTVRNWYHRGVKEIELGDEETLCARFVKAVDEAEREAEAELIDGIAEAGREQFLKSSGEKGDTFERPDWKALAWIAERRGARRWGFKKSIELHLESETEYIFQVAERALRAWPGAFDALVGAIEDERASESEKEEEDE